MLFLQRGATVEGEETEVGEAGKGGGAASESPGGHAGSHDGPAESESGENWAAWKSSLSESVGIWTATPTPPHMRRLPIRNQQVGTGSFTRAHDKNAHLES